MFEEGKFLASDGLQLYYRIWNPKKSNRFVLLLHGKGEHIGRYDEMADFFVGHGYAVAGFDYRGHGHSEGRAVYVERFEELIQDVEFFLTHLKNYFFVSGPILVFAHSLGGLIALKWLKKSQTAVKTLILSSPCLGLPLPNFLVQFNQWMNRIAPKFAYRNPVYPAFLTHDPAEIAKYQKDPYIRRLITPRMLHEMLTAMAELDSAKQWTTPFPVYILVAGLEKIVDGHKAKYFFNKLVAPKKELINFPEMYHEIFRESNRQTVYQTLDRILTASL